jgi:large repetitive protein
MSAAKSARVHGAAIFRVVTALMLTAGVFATAAVTFESSAFADTAPTIANGFGAFSTDPVVNLSGCTAASGSQSLTCSSTAGVQVGMGAYGASLASGTSVSAVTATSVSISAKTSAAVTATQVLTFTTRLAVENVSGSTSSTTVTSSINFANAGVTAGSAVVGPGIAAGTSVASVSGTSLVLSADPTAALSGATLIFNAPDNFDALTLVSGGSSSVNTSSLTVVSQPPAADGTVVANTGNGILSLLPGDAATSAFNASFAYCAPGDSYSPGSPNCTVATMTYSPATDQEIGEEISVSGITQDIYEDTEIAVVAPATAPQNSAVTVTLAPIGSSVPISESTPVGTATINYADGFTSVLPVPSGFSYVPGSIKVTGGDSVTAGVATAELCTAAGSGCDAQINTGNYKTNYPYLELELPSADHVSGGSNFTLPTVTAQFTATGSVGTTASETLSEFRLNTNVSVPIIGTENVTVDAYPTSGNSGTPPYAPPVALGSTKIVAPQVAPSITSGSTTTFTVGSPGTFTVTTSGSPTPALSESGSLPSGVSFVDNGNGTATLSGTSAAGTGGTYPISIKATNGVSPDASQSFTLTVDQAPAITSASNTMFTTGTSGSFTVTSTGFPTATLSESGSLPSGVTFENNGNGTATLSGTPAANAGGSYPITIKAGNGVGAQASQSFTLTVDQAPEITSSNAVTFSIGESNSFTVTSTGYPAAALSESGPLPSGVNFVDNGNGTATLSGDPGGSPQDYAITITASNGVSPDATQSFTLTVSNAAQAPTITSSPSATFTAGSSGSFTVTSVGNPVASLSENGALPGGVSFTDNGAGTATLSGTPAAGTGGVYPITVTATNGVSPDAHQSFTLTVDQAPAITSVSGTTFTAGSSGSFTVTSDGNPTASLGENGALPAGVTFKDNSDGTATLSGTPAAGTGGVYPITITATNGVSPDSHQSFTLTVDQAPAITSASGTTFTTGTAGSFTVSTTGNPTAGISETGALPSGVTFSDNGDGTATLAGTPAASSGGDYPISITATNGVSPQATQSFTLSVDQPSSITSGNHTTFAVGTAGSFTVTTKGFPAPAVSETGALPSGVTFSDNGDGTAGLSGTPAHGSGGSYPITITATNGVGNDATQSFTLTVNEAPYFTSANSATFTFGSSGSFMPTAAGYPAPSITVWGTLPKGITFTNGSLTGTPAKKGTFQVLFTASNGIAPNATQVFTLTIVKFAVSTTSLPTLTEGTPYDVQLQVVGGVSPYTWKAVGSLPSGLTVSKSGLLSGIVSTAKPGNYTIDVSVSDHSKPTKMTASATLSLTIQSGS